MRETTTVTTMTTLLPLRYTPEVQAAARRALIELTQVHGTRDIDTLAKCVAVEMDVYLPDWAAATNPDYLDASAGALTECWVVLGMLRFVGSCAVVRRWAVDAPEGVAAVIEHTIASTRVAGNDTGDWMWATQRLANAVTAVMRAVDPSWQPPSTGLPAGTSLDPGAM
jgi:hypothetical protein